MGLGEVSVALGNKSTDAGAVDLDRALVRLEKSLRAAQWYEADEVEAGQWVQFEAKLSYAVLPDIPDKAGPLLFWEPIELRDSDVRLVLHASVDGLPGQSMPSLSEQRPSTEAWDWQWTISAAQGLAFRLLNDDREYGMIFEKERPLHTVIERLDRAFKPSTAAWMAGYALVTSVDVESTDPDVNPVRRRRFIIASPLYVERVSRPDED